MNTGKLLLLRKSIADKQMTMATKTTTAFSQKGRSYSYFPSEWLSL
jgi:hypothetical protein